MNVEICVDSVESAIAAANGGAERIELCSALSEGGITPSSGLIRTVRSAVDIDLFVIIRPRGGDFVYSDRELEVMARDIDEAKVLGVNGVVLGILTAKGAVDGARTRTLIEHARPMQVTFHRAFDVCNDLGRALEDVIACGADRLLTSGGAPDAVRGSRQIAQIRQQAGDRIRIMAGGGIRTSNVRNLALRTGVIEVHTSLSVPETNVRRTGVHHPEMSFGGCTRFQVMEEDVRAFRAALAADTPASRTRAFVQ
jgi:copper homeostasis protein